MMKIMMKKDIFIGVSSCNASNKIYDEMIILKIKVSECNKDRYNIMIIKVIMLLIVVNW